MAEAAAEAAGIGLEIGAFARALGEAVVEHDLDLLDDAAGAGGHHQDAVGQQDRLVDAVGHQHDGLAGAAPDLKQRVLHRFAGQRVKRAERLVHQQQLRVVDQRAADRDALLHAAGQLARVFVLEAGEAGHGQQFAGAGAVVGLAVTEHLHRQQHVVDHRAPGRQGRCLEHHAHGGLRPRDFRAVDQDAAGAGIGHAEHDLQQRALAAAAGADDGDELAARRAQIDLGQRRDLALARGVGLAEPADLEMRPCAGTHASPSRTCDAQGSARRCASVTSENSARPIAASSTTAAKVSVVSLLAVPVNTR